MAAEIDVIIENNTTTERFLFRGVEFFKPRKSQQPIVIPLINTSPANTFLFRFIGQNETVIFTFALFNDGVDVSGGTAGSPVITVPDQIRYLKDTIFTKDVTGDYDLWNPAENVYEVASPISGLIVDVDFDLKNASKTLTTGSITFQRGRVGGI